MLRAVSTARTEWLSHEASEDDRTTDQQSDGDDDFDDRRSNYDDARDTLNDEYDTPGVNSDANRTSRRVSFQVKCPCSQIVAGSNVVLRHYCSSECAAVHPVPTPLERSHHPRQIRRRLTALIRDYSNEYIMSISMLKKTTSFSRSTKAIISDSDPGAALAVAKHARAAHLISSARAQIVSGADDHVPKSFTSLMFYIATDYTRMRAVQYHLSGVVKEAIGAAVSERRSAASRDDAGNNMVSGNCVTHTAPASGFTADAASLSNAVGDTAQTELLVSHNGDSSVAACSSADAVTGSSSTLRNNAVSTVQHSRRRPRHALDFMTATVGAETDIRASRDKSSAVAMSLPSNSADTVIGGCNTSHHDANDVSQSPRTGLRSSNADTMLLGIAALQNTDCNVGVPPPGSASVGRPLVDAADDSNALRPLRCESEPDAVVAAARCSDGELAPLPLPSLVRDSIDDVTTTHATHAVGAVATAAAITVHQPSRSVLGHHLREAAAIVASVRANVDNTRRRIVANTQAFQSTVGARRKKRPGSHARKQPHQGNVGDLYRLQQAERASAISACKAAVDRLNFMRDDAKMLASWANGGYAKLLVGLPFAISRSAAIVEKWRQLPPLVTGADGPAPYVRVIVACLPAHMCRNVVVPTIPKVAKWFVDIRARSNVWSSLASSTVSSRSRFMLQNARDDDDDLDASADLDAEDLHAMLDPNDASALNYFTLMAFREDTRVPVQKGLPVKADPAAVERRNRALCYLVSGENTGSVRLDAVENAGGGDCGLFSLLEGLAAVLNDANVPEVQRMQIRERITNGAIPFTGANATRFPVDHLEALLRREAGAATRGVTWLRSAIHSYAVADWNVTGRHFYTDDLCYRNELEGGDARLESMHTASQADILRYLDGWNKPGAHEWATTSMFAGAEIVLGVQILLACRTSKRKAIHGIYRVPTPRCWNDECITLVILATGEYHFEYARLISSGVLTHTVTSTCLQLCQSEFNKKTDLG